MRFIVALALLAGTILLFGSLAPWPWGIAAGVLLGWWLANCVLGIEPMPGEWL